MSYSFNHSYVGDFDSGIPAKNIDHTIDADDLSLDELIPAFEDFLRGCGYVFDGHLEIVNNEADSFNDFDANQAKLSLPEETAETETTNPNPSVQTEFNFEQKQEGGNGI